MTIQRKSANHDAAIHPGHFLREDFLVPMGLSANALALALRVPVTRISEILRERRGITADTALRLARYFGNSADFWMEMQVSYDLALASLHAAVRIHAEVIPAPRGARTAGTTAGIEMHANRANDARSRSSRMKVTV